MIRIIAGKYKNRVIPSLKHADYRPSTGKIRESIFSILTSGEFQDNRLFSNESKVLDLFAGTGSLGFESYSRGAGTIILVDININYLRIAGEFANSIRGQDNRYLSKLAYAQGFVGGSESRSAAHLSVREDSSLEPTPKLPAEVEFQKISNIRFLNINAIDLPRASYPFDLIFIDPPYYRNLVSQAVNALKRGLWLKENSIIVIELAKTDDFVDSTLELIKQKIYGDSKLLIMRYIAKNTR